MFFLPKICLSFNSEAVLFTLFFSAIESKIESTTRFISFCTLEIFLFQEPFLDIESGSKSLSYLCEKKKHYQGFQQRY